MSLPKKNNTEPMDIVFFILSGLLLFLGLLGAILPILPGPPLSYLGLLILQLTEPTPFTTRFMIIWAVITLVVTVMDYLIPALGAKRYGATRYGILGTMIGLIAGFFFFPPLGIIIGPVIGALLGEYLYSRNHRQAGRAAFGSFMGFMVSTLLKMTASAVMLFYYVVEIF